MPPPWPSGDTFRWIWHQVGFGPNGRNTGDQFGSSVASSGELQVHGVPGQAYDADGLYVGTSAGAIFVSHYGWSTAE